MRGAEESLHLVAATVGFLSFLLLWLAVLWGLFLRNAWASTRVRHSTLYAIHSAVGLLGLCLALVHTGAQLTVPGAHFRLVDLVVPFLYWRDPLGTGAAVIGLELLVAVVLSVGFQRLLGHSRWRTLHTLTYVAFTLVTAHILISGSDLGSPLLSGGVIGAWAVTVLGWLTTTPVAAGLRGLVGRRGETAGERPPGVVVDVDARRCARFGFCEHEAPEVFRLRGDGRLAYRASVPADEATPVTRAAEVCPARAITLTRLHSVVAAPYPPPGRATRRRGR